MSTSFSKRKKRIFSTSNISTIEKRAIFLTNIFRRKTKIQKTNDNLNNLHINESNMDNTLEATLE